ncbi:MAG: Ig-like domain-containing protein, partial [Chitinophagaceae bacterium]|nr:Ig-like domain-containing protein [Chitinophagaceae bacterium]
MLFIITFGLILSSCGGSSSGGGSGGGGGSMIVTMTSPGANATGVSTTPSIILNTSLPAATPIASTAIVLQTSAGVVVPINTPTVSNVSGVGIITFTAASTLQSNTQYQVVVNPTLLSTSGIAATAVTFQFTTGSTSGFVVNISAPVNGSTVSSLLPSITLVSGSGFLNASNVSSNVQLTRGSTVVTLPTAVLSSNNTIATFTLTTPLLSSSAYIITVTGGSSGIQSSAGATMTGNVTSSFNTGLMAMVYTAGGVLSANVALSGDGINWMVDMLSTNFQQFIVSGSNVLILGARGSVATPSATLFSSYQMQKFPTLTTQAVNQYASNGSGTVVGVGGVAGTGIVVYSTNNGASWNQLTLGVNPLTQVAFGNGIFVALDTAGNAYNSTNGISWSALTATGLGAGATVPVLSFANGFFVAVTNAATGLNFSSPNGTAWAAGTATAVGGNSLAFGTISGVNYWVIGEITGAIAYQVVAANTAPTGAWTQVATLVGANGIRTMTFGNNL